MQLNLLSLILFIALSFLGPIFVENDTDPIWDSEYKGKKQDEYVDIKEDNNGRIVALGNTNSIKHKSTDILISQYDKEGKLIREKNIGSFKDDIAAKLLVHKNNYYVVGKTSSTFEKSFGGFDAWIFALDKNLNVVWSKVVGSPNDDGFTDIILTESGNLLAVGYYFNNPYFYEISLDGTEISTKQLTKIGYAATITESDEYYYIAGNDCLDCKDLKTIAFVSAVSKDDFEVQWSDVLSDEFFSRSVDSEIINNELIILGNVDVVNDPRYQAVLARYKIDGHSFIDYKEYGGKWDDLANDLFYNRAKDQIIISGQSKSFSKAKKEEYKAWQLKLNLSFEELESSFEGTIHHDAYSSVVYTSDGLTIFAGIKHKDAWIAAASKDENSTGLQDLSKLQIEGISFEDEGNDNKLNESEKGTIRFKVKNPSQNIYNNVRVCFETAELASNDLELPSCYLINTLGQDAEELVEVSIASGSSLTSEVYDIPIVIGDSNFGSVVIETQEKQFTSLDYSADKGSYELEKERLLGTYTYNFTVKNNGNLATGPLVANISASQGVDIVENKKTIEVGASGESTLAVELIIDHTKIGNDPQVFISLENQENTSSLNIKESIDVADYKQEVNNILVESAQAEKAAEELARIEAIKKEREAELKQMDDLKTILADSISGITLSDEKKYELTSRLAEINIEEAEIFKRDYSDIVEDHTFIKPYVLDEYIETYDDIQEVILLLEHEEDFGFENLTLLLNGEMISEGIDYLEDDLSLDIKQKGKNKMVIEYRNKIRLKKGTNTISFSAVYDEETYTPSAPLTIEKKINKTNLHLISIGVPDISQEAAYRLKYTTKDAADLAGLFTAGQIDDYHNTTIDLFNTQEQTTSQGIKSTIQKMKKTDYNPEDMVVLYISSHAFYSEDFGELFVSTSDYDFLNAEASSLRFNNDIIDWLKRLPCNVILLLDICHSGHILNESEMEDGASNATTQIIEYLDKSKGKKSNINVISSSGSGEYSYEIDKLSNSAFMAAIKEAIHNQTHTCDGMDFKADQDNNRSLQLYEMVDFIRQRVPCLASEYKKGDQNPRAVVTSDLDLKVYPEL